MCLSDWSKSLLYWSDTRQKSGSRINKLAYLFLHAHVQRFKAHALPLCDEHSDTPLFPYNETHTLLGILLYKHTCRRASLHPQAQSPFSKSRGKANQPPASCPYLALQNTHTHPTTSILPVSYMQQVRTLSIRTPSEVSCKNAQIKSHTTAHTSCRVFMMHAQISDQ